MTTMLTQFGVVDESAYGTPLTPIRFFEYNNESLKPEQGRASSSGMRAGGRVQRADRFEPYRVGAGGDVEFDVPTKGFGFWLKHMLGTVGTTGPTDANYVHSGTVGSLLGDFFTAQFNKPFHPSGTNQPFTYHGCKIASWELSCDVDGVLVCSLSIDAEDEDTSTALAVASYPADYRIFSWTGGSVTIGGSAVELRDFKVSCDNGLNVDRRYLRASALKKEPVEDAFREIEFSCTADFVDLTQYDRFRSSTRVGTLAAIVATFDGPVAHGGTTLPRLEVTIPAARFDEVEVNVDGPEALTQSISGVGLFDSTNSPITVSYRTTDVTP
jgi:Phage tail tube protein